MPSVRARADDLGNVSLYIQGRRRQILQLSCDVAPPGRPDRPRSSEGVFAAVSSEGADHGLRGFSAGADDDNDGRVDEDRLDGKDNDGDGLVDEDFAAIGDVMAVWDSTGPRSSLHREYYHWANDVIKAALFFTVDSQSRSGDTAPVILEADYPWTAVQVSSVRHSLAGKPETLHARALVTAVAGVGDNASDVWIGFLVLGHEGTDGVAPAGLGRLEVNPGGGFLAGAIVVAQSWRQLSNLLCGAALVYRGVVDPVTGQQARWIVSPTCSLCRRAPSPESVWQPGSGGGGTLTFNLKENDGRIPDPDLLTLNGKALGSPAEILWRGPLGQEKTAPWSRYRFQDLLRNRPIPTSMWDMFPGLKNHGTTDKIVFIFHRTPGPLVDLKERTTPPVLAGRGLDGRKWKAELRLEPESAVDDRAEGLEMLSRPKTADGEQPVLSPRLMLGWPNPFRDRIQIQCRIPATAREAFAPVRESELSPGRDKTNESLPWGEGEPSVSVRIYSLSGQEIRTLYTGRQGAGEFVVQWDGTDTFGRPVASGPYLCKLQMDELSVTRRLVYLR